LKQRGESGTQKARSGTGPVLTAAGRESATAAHSRALNAGVATIRLLIFERSAEGSSVAGVMCAPRLMLQTVESVAARVNVSGLILLDLVPIDARETAKCAAS